MWFLVGGPTMTRFLIFLALCSIAGAQLPSESLNISGVVTDAVGAPLTGTVNLRFFIYDAPVGGTPTRSMATGR